MVVSFGIFCFGFSAWICRKMFSLGIVLCDASLPEHRIFNSFCHMSQGSIIMAPGRGGQRPLVMRREPWAMSHKACVKHHQASSYQVGKLLIKYSAITLAIGICSIQLKESLPPPTFLENMTWYFYYISSRREKSPPSTHRPVYLTAPNLFGSNKSTRNVIPITLTILKTCETSKMPTKCCQIDPGSPHECETWLPFVIRARVVFGLELQLC